MSKKAYVTIAIEKDTRTHSPKFIDIEYTTNIEDVMEGCAGYCSDCRILFNFNRVEERMQEDLRRLKEMRRMYYGMEVHDE